jgi:hypothetical protein
MEMNIDFLLLHCISRGLSSFSLAAHMDIFKENQAVFKSTEFCFILFYCKTRA